MSLSAQLQVPKEPSKRPEEPMFLQTRASPGVDSFFHSQNTFPRTYSERGSVLDMGDRAVNETDTIVALRKLAF